jgi:chemotaxis protein MotB
VSYADFITLLFAFFVVMFATSQADKGKAGMLAESVRQALGKDGFSAAVAALWGGTVGETGPGNAMKRGPGGTQKENSPGVAELVPAQQLLQDKLKQELEAGKLEIHMEVRGLVVSLKQAAYFPSGEDSIAPGMYESLDRVAEVIRDLPNQIRVEGHTDTVPIDNHRFKNNWELSAARGIAMLAFLTIRSGIPESRLTVSAHAHTVPADRNDTEEGRARNRRVNLVLLSRYGVLNEPAKPDPASTSSHLTPFAR